MGVIYDISTEEHSFINGFSNQERSDPKLHFIKIFKNNTKLTFFILLGFISMGIYSLALLCWNGFHLGTQILSFSELSTTSLVLLYLYISIEFFAFCLAVTAAEKTCLDLFRYFSYGDKIREIQKTLFIILFSFILTTTAAMLETLYIYSSS